MIYVQPVITVHVDPVNQYHVILVNTVNMLVFKSLPVTVPLVSTVPDHLLSPTNISVLKESTVRKVPVFRIFVRMEHSVVVKGIEI